MLSPLPPRRSRRRLALRLLTAVKAGAVASVLLLAVLGGLRPSAVVHDDSAPAASDDVLVQAMAQHGCSVTGLHGEIPGSTLIRTADGEVRQVSFDRGWAVWTHHRPGTLLAVCREAKD